MPRYVIHKDGVIQRIVVCSSSQIDVQPVDGEGYIQEDDPSITDKTHYLDGGVLTPRPSMGLVFAPSSKEIAADSVEELTITGVPNAASVTMIGPGVVEKYTADGTAITYTFDAAGQYKFRVEAHPYLTEEFTCVGT